MIKYFLFILLFHSSNFSFSQSSFLFEQISLDSIRSLEDSLNSDILGFVNTQVGDDYFSSAKSDYTYTPLCFERTNDSFFPELIIEYFYNEVDSTLLAASYTWSIMNEITNLKTDGHLLEKEKLRKKDYLAKYKSIKIDLIELFGSPDLKLEPKDKKGYFYKLEWIREDIEILLLLKFSEELIELPGNMKIGSYEVRVKVNFL